MSMRYSFKIILFLTAMLAMASNPFAASLVATVQDLEGAGLKDAVVTATAVNGANNTAPAGEAVIDQIDKEFIPYVSVFQAGARVIFPNHDKIRHHVYSFSPTKSFEIPLYSGTPPEPILFDQAGVVSLGCNIHDWMTAYAYIVETPYYGIANENGEVELNGLAPGEYEIQAWHPRQQDNPESTKVRITIQDSANDPLQFQFATKKLWQAFRAPSGGAGGYR